MPLNTSAIARAAAERIMDRVVDEGSRRLLSGEGSKIMPRAHLVTIFECEVTKAIIEAIDGVLTELGEYKTSATADS